jgi:hypothetical protein
MAIPRVFVSSTFYDLRYIRENLSLFIRNMGFEPILSEKGNVFYDPKQSAKDACLTEVGSAQLFVLVIGGRFGSKYKDTKKSITNCEYEEAVKKNIPIYALVERQVLSEFRVYEHQKNSQNLDMSKMSYPSVDSNEIFEFIERVSNNPINNALEPFSEYNEVEQYLKQQWAALVFNFLTKQTETANINSNFDTLKLMNERLEFLSKQILKSVGTDVAKAALKIYDRMLESKSIRDLAYCKIKVSPKEVLQETSFDNLIKNKIKIKETAGWSISSEGEISRAQYLDDKADYAELRKEVLQLLANANINPEEIISSYIE